MSERMDQYHKLYEAYCNYHGFKRNITWELFGECEVIEYHTDQLVGISLYKVFDDQFVAMQFIWNYAEPKLSLGNIAQMTECAVAKEKGCTHVYLLGGYEHCCRYKAGFKGFEFWTGTEWSQDIDLFYRLVERDEKIQILHYDDV
jgi:arginyl-tRNA--protein-N-Asp/Glu arginylyltransferase